MSTTEIIDGTLNPDGSLELDDMPTIDPGRVRVVLQPIQPQPARRGLTDVIDRIHRDQRARGFVGRSIDEIEAGLHEGEEEYERRMEALWSENAPNNG